MEEEKYVSGEEFNVLKAKKSSPKTPSPKQNQRIILIIVAIIWTVGVFYIGVAYQKHNNPKTATTVTNTNGTLPGGRFGGFGGNFADRTFGTVTAISSTSITINNTRTGASSTLTINSSTTATENGQTIAISSISVGETVSIQESSTNKTIASSIMVLNFQSGSSTSSNGSSTGSSTSTQTESD